MVSMDRSNSSARVRAVIKLLLSNITNLRPSLAHRSCLIILVVADIVSCKTNNSQLLSLSCMSNGIVKKRGQSLKYVFKCYFFIF